MKSTSLLRDSDNKLIVYRDKDGDGVYDSSIGIEGGLEEKNI